MDTFAYVFRISTILDDYHAVVLYLTNIACVSMFTKYPSAHRVWLFYASSSLSFSFGNFLSNFSFAGLPKHVRITYVRSIRV